MARCAIVYWIHWLWPLDWLDQKHYLKIGEKDISGRSMQYMISVCMEYDLSKWKNEVKIQVNAYWKGTSTEKVFSNQVDRITPFYGELAYQCLIHYPMDLWTKRPRWQRWGLSVDLTTWTATFQGWSGYSSCWAPVLPTADTNTEPQIWMTLWPGGASQRSSGTLTT